MASAVCYLVGTAASGLVGRPAEPGPLLLVFTELIGVGSDSEPYAIILECHPNFKFRVTPQAKFWISFTLF